MQPSAWLCAHLCINRNLTSDIGIGIVLQVAIVTDKTASPVAASSLTRRTIETGRKCGAEILILLGIRQTLETLQAQLQRTVAIPDPG
ncbi:MAG: hypothetical protein ABW166_21225 [Sedimenticola sp.]